MAPAKSSRKDASEECSLKPEPAGAKEKGNANGKLRRVTSSTNSGLREVTSASAAKEAPKPPCTAAATTQDAAVQGLQWPAFERDVLHAYRRAYLLNTPTAVSKDYHLWVLTQAGSVGLYSPTIARRKEVRRQSVDGLGGAVRQHFNGLGVQEADVIVDFLRKVRSSGVSKSNSHRQRRAEYSSGPRI